MKVINSTPYNILDKDIISGKGMEVFNSQGKTFLDFESGVWALPLGHNPEKLNEVYISQTKKLTHVGYLYHSQIIEETAEKLLEISNIKDGKCVFLSSGSEAVEYAIQAAKTIFPNKKGCRIGRYFLSAYGSASAKIKEWIEINDSIEEIDFSEIGYFVFEPGNYSGLVKLPNKDLIKSIVNKIRENGGIIIVDEVTTGFGRTGKWFGYMNYDLNPDVIAIGKGLGNGYPVSAVVFKDKVIDKALNQGFRYAQSHQNDPLGAKIAGAVIEEIINFNLIKNSEKMGIYFREQLMKLADKFPIINNVRGIGLMNAISFVDDIDEDSIRQMQLDLCKKGMFVQVIPSYKVMRFYPPLIISHKEIDYLIKGLDVIFSKICNS